MSTRRQNCFMGHFKREFDIWKHGEILIELDWRRKVLDMLIELGWTWKHCEILIKLDCHWKHKWHVNCWARMTLQTHWNVNWTWSSSKTKWNTNSSFLWFYVVIQDCIVVTMTHQPEVSTISQNHIVNKWSLISYFASLCKND